MLLALAVGINVFASGRAIGERLFGAIVALSAAGVDLGRPVLGPRDPFSRSVFRRSRRSAGLSGWVYFSFVTLTTVGYGDITPITTGARQLAMLEALVGQLYPAVIIARLVSLQDQSK